MKTYGTKLVISLVAFVAIVGGIFAYVARSGVSVPADSSLPVTSPVTSTTVPADTKGTYKDGVYTAVGRYRSPEGAESIGVSITLKDGIVVDSTVTSNATDGKSIRYQGFFIGGYKALVVGKSLDAIKLTKVSGSSLTPGGFNNALEQIKVQAQA